MNAPSLRATMGLVVVVGLIAGGVASAHAQRGSIAGRVTDQTTGQPLVGARVIVVGTALITQANAEGRYTLQGVPAGTATLRVSSIGYGAASISVTVVAGETAAQDVALKLQPFSLDEVVVTATGEEAKKAVGNTVNTVRADSVVQNNPIANMNDLLGSRVPGVEVLPGTITGAGARVRIRGMNSLSLNNEPIYYIDGVRMTSDVNSSSIGIGGTNPSRVNDINPEEIESLEIVKGPAASTLYGTDAANGVIVIKTKRGQSGPAKWNLYNELGIIKDDNQYPIAYRGWYTNPRTAIPDSSSQPTNLIECFLTNTVRAPADPLYCKQDSVSTFDLFADPDASPNGTGWRGQTGLQVSGGSDVVRYFVSGEYEKEIGVLRMPPFAWNRAVAARQIAEVPYDQYRPNARERVSVRANFQASVDPRLDVAVNTNFISSSQRLPQTDNNTTGLLSNGFGGPGNKDNGRFGYRLFMPDEFFSETVRQDINRFIGSGTANWRPTSWLSARIGGGIDFTDREDSDLCRRDECTSFSGSFGSAKLGSKTDNRTNVGQYTLDANAAASYGLTLTLRAKTTVGMQYFQTVFARNGAFGFDLVPFATTVNAAAIQLGDESTTETKTLGGFVEQQFIYKDRLWVTTALRGDDNSAFGKDFSAVYYPKLSLSYVISDESFFRAPSWLSNLRLRAAYGASGTQPGSVDAIPFWLPVVTSVDGVDRGGLVFSAVGNDTLKPERATELEAGFDATLFDSRINAELTYYTKLTKDALIARPLPPSAGAAATRFENLGSVRNRGVELLINAVLVNRPQFGWDITLNASTAHNKIEKLGLLTPIVGTTTRQQEGYPIDGWWQQPYTYRDEDGNGVITANEIVVADSAKYIGPSNPTREITLVSGFDFFNRRLRISGTFDHKGGRYQLNGTERIRCESRLNCDGEIDPRAPLWKQARAVALRETAARTQYGYIEKADFIRFREFSASYSLPDAWARAVHATRATLTLAARNLFLITDYSGIDPESNYFSGATGIQSDFQTQPPPTYWTLRVNLGF